MDKKGNLVESLNGFNFSTRSMWCSRNIALNPNTRSGYVDGLDVDATEIQSFTY
jgi:hypothetical protein